MSDSLGLLRATGTVGWDDIEEPIFTLVLTGDPCLLFGSKGANKTNAVRGIAEIELNDENWHNYFHAYSLPNDEWEDILGIPDPSGLKNGQMKYIISPNTVWHKKFIMLDEANRPNAATQSKWLQMTLSREVLGQRTDVVHVFAGMNPLSYPGTNPMDPAFADRFAFMLPVPEFHSLSEEDQVLAIGNQGADSLYGFKNHNKDLRTAVVENDTYSNQRVRNAREKWVDIKNEVLGSKNQDGIVLDVIKTHGPAISSFLSNVTNLMARGYDKEESFEKKENKLSQLISGRRASMMWRSMVTRLALNNAINGRFARKAEVQRIIQDTFEKSLTTKATGSEFDLAGFMSAYPSAIKVISSVGEQWDNKIELEKDPIKKLAMVLSYKRDNDALDKLETLIGIPPMNDQGKNRLTCSLKFENDTLYRGADVLNTYIIPGICALYLAPLIEVDNSTLSSNIRAKIANKANAALRFFERNNGDLSAIANTSLRAKILELFERFDKKVKETGDPYYTYSKMVFSYSCMGLSPIINTDIDAEKSPEKWTKDLDVFVDDVFKAHQDCHLYLGPVVRELFSQSNLPTGMLEEDHNKEMALLEKTFRGKNKNVNKALPENDTVQASEETPTVVNTDLTVAVKRGRGRPRKTVVAEPVIETPNTEEVTISEEEPIKQEAESIQLSDADSSIDLETPTPSFLSKLDYVDVSDEDTNSISEKLFSSIFSQ